METSPAIKYAKPIKRCKTPEGKVDKYFTADNKIIGTVTYSSKLLITRMSTPVLKSLRLIRPQHRDLSQRISHSHVIIIIIISSGKNYTK